MHIGISYIRLRIWVFAILFSLLPYSAHCIHLPSHNVNLTHTPHIAYISHLTMSTSHTHHTLHTSPFSQCQPHTHTTHCIHLPSHNVNLTHTYHTLHTSPFSQCQPHTHTTHCIHLPSHNVNLTHTYHTLHTSPISQYQPHTHTTHFHPPPLTTHSQSTPHLTVNPSHTSHPHTHTPHSQSTPHLTPHTSHPQTLTPTHLFHHLPTSVRWEVQDIEARVSNRKTKTTGTTVRPLDDHLADKRQEKRNDTDKDGMRASHMPSPACSPVRQQEHDRYLSGTLHKTAMRYIPLMHCIILQVHCIIPPVYCTITLWPCTNLKTSVCLLEAGRGTPSRMF